jgi:hypothetical protein
MRKKCRYVRVFECSKAEKTGAVAEIGEQLCFLDGLRREAANTADADERFCSFAVGTVHFFRS